MTNARPALLSPIAHTISVVDHLPGLRLPNLALPSTNGGTVPLRKTGSFAVVSVYPMIGRHEIPNTERREEVPNTRAGAPDACEFQTRHRGFQLLRVGVYGLSSQSPEYQSETALRLSLSFPLLSDTTLELAERLGLPTFEVQGSRLYRGLTLVVASGIVRHVFYPVDDPAVHAEAVLGWFRAHQV